MSQVDAAHYLSESLFGLMNLQPGRDPDHAARTRTLLEARGLSPAAAAALAGETP